MGSKFNFLKEKETLILEGLSEAIVLSLDNELSVN